MVGKQELLKLKFSNFKLSSRHESQIVVTSGKRFDVIENVLFWLKF